MQEKDDFSTIDAGSWVEKIPVFQIGIEPTHMYHLDCLPIKSRCPTTQLKKTHGRLVGTLKATNLSSCDKQYPALWFL